MIVRESVSALRFHLVNRTQVSPQWRTQVSSSDRSYSRIALSTLLTGTIILGIYTTCSLAKWGNKKD